ncbi:maleylpyruvate isomerase family mycothiol-dependent enzyme [Streptomyces sp.]|uniref:maleylpyruvate isomerase family mycothiol-dependent enzyme n=1 Tax=Streptomyces sp. TaxID=1931 RepID=UPI002BD472A3|nr:maleylpyruvate isomerase family mycothiol-dependent enzyme [Streptomyces sp.]HLL33503.1 maleylpyruvate isomerase family mycothiol-dependent enzyme [Streptomyces sp.]HZF86891.1 maleylpyruvate isomerase family mycothiol-dependent enzyme [Streptomyces sp.]
MALDRETARLRAWLTDADDQRWSRGTRCTEWDVHDVVAHLTSGELYNQHCLRDDIESLRAWGDWGEDDEAYNVLHVALRRPLSHTQVFDEWIERHTDVHARWRAMPPDAPLSTSYGPYAVGLQCWHIASEYATHSDDMGVPVPDEDRAERLAWRFAFSRYAVEERGVPVSLDVHEGTNTISVSDETARVTLTDEQFVAAVSQRLPLESVTSDPHVRLLIEKLKVLL